MQLYALMIVSILFAVWNNCLYHSVREKNLNSSSTWFFNAVSSVLSFVLMVCLNGGFGGITVSSALWGAAYGIVTAAFLISKMSALSSGPIAITTLIGNCSLIIPTLFGILYYNEEVSIFQLFGFVMILVSFFLCSKFSREDKRPGKKWIFWCIVFFISTGGVSLVFKLHQASPAKAEINQMMIVAYAVASVLLAVVSLIGNKTSQTVHNVFKKDVLLSVLLCAIAGTVYNRLNLFLTGALPSIVFFPIFNGGVILLVSLLGVWLYKEKLSLKNTIGILIGISAIIFIGVL